MRFDDTIKRLDRDDDRIAAADGDVIRKDDSFGRTWQELTRPIPDMLGDWVPGAYDRLQNGGFAISPDNGAPVPYRLNGHVHIEH